MSIDLSIDYPLMIFKGMYLILKGSKIVDIFKSQNNSKWSFISEILYRVYIYNIFHILFSVVLYEMLKQ